MTNKNWFKTLTPEQQTEYRKKQREKYNSLTSEQKEKRKRKRHEYEQQKLSKLPLEKQIEKKKQSLQRLKNYVDNLSIEEQKKQRDRITKKHNRKAYDALTLEDIEKRKAYMRKRYAQMTPEQHEAERQRGREYKAKLKNALMFHYSNGTMRCMNPNCEVPGGAKNILALQIDHINGGGHKQAEELRKKGMIFYQWLYKNGMPSGFQVLCASCNQIKKVENKEDHYTDRLKKEIKRRASS